MKQLGLFSFLLGVLPASLSVACMVLPVERSHPPEPSPPSSDAIMRPRRAIHHHTSSTSQSSGSTQTTSSTSSSSSYTSSGSDSTSTSTISLSASSLNQPHRLIIRTTGTELTGQITYDGTVIQPLQSTETAIDLAPRLQAGSHRVEISGRYTPATALTTIEWVSPGNHVTQQSSGDGTLHHQLILQVN